MAALAEEKRAQILKPLAEKASAPLKDLLRLLEIKGRLALLSAIAELFLHMEEAGRKVRRASIVSATALDAGQLESLAKGLAARNPGHTYLLRNEVDASLIAGFRIEEDGLVTDTSLRHKLDGARRSLATAQ
jgi:ATP synthase F1 delta subunit